MSSSDPSTPPAAEPIPVAGEPRRGPEPAQPEPGLHVVSTPIGHLRDITLRALDTLAGVDEILAEDTRTARRLLTAHGIGGNVTPYHDHNGAARRPEIVDALKAGAAIALVSDAGTPLISDPGWKLVRDALDAGVKVIPCPGPSALLAGLVASGLPSDRFLFAGFPPTKSAARRRFFDTLAATPATLVFYEAAPRLAASLADMAASFGPRQAAVARELTKLFEETRRGPLASLARDYAAGPQPKGELVVLVGPPPAAPAPTADELDAALRLALKTAALRDAAADVAARFDLPKRTVYQRALQIRDGDG